MVSLLVFSVIIDTQEIGENVQKYTTTLRQFAKGVCFDALLLHSKYFHNSIIPYGSYGVF